MNSLMQCSICSQPYAVPTRIPRGCAKCGNNICQECLRSIHAKSSRYACPFCKEATSEIWAKNLPLIQMIEERSSGNVCVPHKRKIVSLCASPACKLPAGICDKADCSRMHSEFGMNCLPIGLIEDDGEEVDTSHLSRCVDHLYQELETAITKLIKSRRNKASSHLSPEKSAANKQQMNVKSIASLSSSEISKIKSKIMSEQSKSKTTQDQRLEMEKESAARDIIELLSTIKINYDNVVKQQKPKEVLVQTPKPPPSTDFLPQLLERVLGKKFTLNKLFDSTSHRPAEFNKKLGGKKQLLSRVELRDGTIFGSYFNIEFPINITGQRRYKDSRAFVYWLNNKTHFPANIHGESQFDVSKDYLFSVGNTNKWDGFWFKSDFQTVNPGRSELKMVSDEYNGLNISFTTTAVKKLEIFQLTG